MSDAVTNVEIEDVLSSIRRLVSDDVRAPKPVPEAVKQPEKLVLTPALRVGAQEGVAHESPKPPVLLTGLESVSDDTDLEETADVFPDIPKADLKSDAPDRSDVVFLAQENAADDDDATDDLDVVTLAEVLKTPHAEQPDDDAAKDDGLGDALSQLVGQEVERALSEVDLVAGAEDTDADPEEDELDLQNLVAQLEQVTWDDEPADAPTHELESELAKADTPAPSEAAGALDGESLEGKIAALEELVGCGPSKSLDDEPAVSEAAVFHRSPHVLDWHDTVIEDLEPENPIVLTEVVDADFQSEPETPDAPDDPDASPIPGLIDEDTLRVLVSDIVRQELQGALGERITRNVRKLVRREIHRALMSQDFE